MTPKSGNRRARFWARPGWAPRTQSQSLFEEVPLSRNRLAAVAATLTCAFMLVGGTGIASAQTSSTQTFNKVVKVTGIAKNGKKLKAKYTIDHFIAKGSKTEAVGTLKGTIGKTHFTKRNVKMPVAPNTGS